MSAQSPAEQGGSTAAVIEEPANPPEHPKRFNMSWAISLFGTAVGAGILLLPISAGAGGVWPLLIITIIIGPLAFLAHRALSRFVLSSRVPGSDITMVAEQNYGRVWGMVITIVYFLAILPFVLVYGVAITSTVDSFLVNQLHGPEIPRWLLALVLIGAMMAVMFFGLNLMLKVTSFLVWPLIAALAFFTLYLIPMWDLSAFSARPTVGSLVFSVWLSIPVLVFAFSHTPAISQFSLSMRDAYGDRAEQEASRTLRVANILLVIFTMAFVWSCVLAMGPSKLAEARAQNLTVLSYLANDTGVAIIGIMGPIIAICAITSSFFGHYLGVAEGVVAMIRDSAPRFTERLGEKGVKYLVAAIIFAIVYVTAVVNPQILDLIESMSGPVLAAILFVLPIVGIYTIPGLTKYRRDYLRNGFVLIFGLIAISGVLFTLFTGA
ncbi:HAAAP family serine/threonine permease [Helcobacillus massiliensis]|uniref:Serine transporter n=1 Tax=Helcobacillus massiliensis TaxID=521392 RepID=A0A839QRF5_9MICO|nr:MULTISPECIES: HAAAP family serine/threonine permease [Helcobacillus]MBB3022248.1 serine transporter [Helcobacillus massiliensis]MCG7426529.1 HAAAP family serine/threonine permease [Helcobacillus sp. ACRRO]MCT1556890.1 HAAAP family serine/threonine permease [Helcobacillus massiliensis]MCT2037491.1 HAAAP family serine/threonine permease [Helcobacillus massiliensis]MCT2331506.1 HAAAP family serine/threonine permease [Helcobacillus massiliensis]